MSMVQFQGALFLTQLSANLPGKAMELGPSIWVPGNCLGVVDEVLDFWFQPGPATATEVI